MASAASTALSASSMESLLRSFLQAIQDGGLEFVDLCHACGVVFDSAELVHRDGVDHCAVCDGVVPTKPGIYPSMTTSGFLTTFTRSLAERMETRSLTDNGFDQYSLDIRTGRLVHHDDRGMHSSKAQ